MDKQFEATNSTDITKNSDVNNKIDSYDIHDFKSKPQEAAIIKQDIYYKKP